MKGPAAYIQAHRAEVLGALQRKRLGAEFFMHSSESMHECAPGSVELIVTSPPYPMIEMWDRQFQDHAAEGTNGSGGAASEIRLHDYDRFHERLEPVWRECWRILADGGILCLNIGDATRRVEGNFRCFPNHARLLVELERIGFQALVPILWKKVTNKPNAFLGSGFLPTNAYVTLDCEFILLFRKGSPRRFAPLDPLRYASEFSKPERDEWFSQIWSLRGARQDQEHTAPFPQEIPYRLIRMFSCLGDTVVDPFAGSGVTLKVAREHGRRAIGFEINHALEPVLRSNVPRVALPADAVIDNILKHYRPANQPSQSQTGPSVATISGEIKP
jgi:DNA modification methylase